METPNQILITLDDSIFDNIGKIPDLPKAKFKKDKVEYEVTDLTYLNGYAKQVFSEIFDWVVNGRAVSKVSFNVTGIPDDEQDIMQNILLGIHFSAEKKGKGGFSINGPFLVTNIETTTYDGKTTMTVNLYEPDSETIFEDAFGKKQYTLAEAVIAVSNAHIKWFHEAYERGEVLL